MKSLSLKILCVTLIFCVLFITSCSKANTSTSNIIVEFSSFTGTKQKEIQLSSNDTKLSLEGTISLSSGSIEISLIGKDTNEILYEKSINEKCDNNISIDVEDLKNNCNLVLNLKATNAENFSLNLVSAQKLIKDKERPMVTSVR